MIAVSPDCFTRYGGSQFLNSSATGDYQDYLISEVVPFVDANYRTIARPSGRAVLGKSSGGYGALVLTMKHPDVFGACASHAGDMAFELVYWPDFPKTANRLGKDPDPLGFFDEFTAAVKKPGRDFPVLNTLAMAACYSPNPASKWGFDLPFDTVTCELRDDVWARWLEHDPLCMLDQPSFADALRHCRVVHIDAGRQDNYNLHFGARRLAAKLTSLKIPHDHEEFEGDHFGLSYRYDVSIPKLVMALDPVG